MTSMSSAYSTKDLAALASLQAELSDIEQVIDPVQVAKLSQDYYYFSPILQPIFAGKRADLVLRPTDEVEVLTIARSAVKHKLPITIRGAGTGNYGQSVPLNGGIVLDMTRMNTVKSVGPGWVCAESGTKLAAIDRVTRASGWELRMAPSTYRSATIGGFIGGGSGGVGSVTYGQLRDRGNIRAIRLVTLEDEPRIITLRGDEVYQVAHAYGTNGIITEVEMPLAPAYPWSEAIVAFPTFMQAATFGQALSDSDGMIKKLVTVFASPIAQYFTSLQTVIPDGSHTAFVMIAEESYPAFQELVSTLGGEVVLYKTAEEASRGTPIYEYTWNHTTLLARSVDDNLTYLQTLFPYDRDLNFVQNCYEHFGNEVMIHLEFMRVDGRTTPGALQLVKFSSPERLQDIIDYHEKNGAFIFNPHAYTIEAGGMKQVDRAQVNFKKQVDPYGLLNPGKMEGWTG